MENTNKVISLSKLASEFGVSRNACHKVIKKLVEEGYNITLIERKGYVYKYQDKLSKEVLNDELDLNIELLETIDSTNTYLKSNEQLDLVVSLEQVTGKGRRGKSFVSAFDKGIYMTYRYNNKIDIDDISFVTICSAVALRRVIKNLYNIDLDIKWLNDLYFNNKKICGILTEATILAEERKATNFVVGVGLNVYNVCDEIKDIATSIEEISDVCINRNNIIIKFISMFNELCDEVFINNKREVILDEYISYQFIIGKNINIEDDGNIYSAKVLGIDSSARLIIEDDMGQIKHIYNGMVSLKL